MNTLIRVHKDFPIVSLIPLRHLIYATLLSDVRQYAEEDGTISAVSRFSLDDIRDSFGEWAEMDSKNNLLEDALNELGSEGLVLFDDDEGLIFVGEFRGKRFFPYEQETNIFSESKDKLMEAISMYGRSKSAKDKSRSKFIRSRIDELFDKGIENLTPSDFTDLHGYCYELYTGGEIYILRNKVEHFQTNNMLKAYDRHSTFSIIVEGVLNFDKYRKKGLPTLTTIACMKDDVFKGLTKSGDAKGYMRDISKVIDEDSTF